MKKGTEQNGVRIVHLQKRIDRHFRVSRKRAPGKRRSYQRWGIALALLLLIALLWWMQRPATPNLSEKDILAIVNGEPITFDALAKYRQQLPTQIGDISQAQLLDQAINELLLLQETRRQGIAVTPEEVDGLIAATLQERNASWEDLNAVLQERGMTLAELREIYRNQLAIIRMLDAAMPISITDEQIGQFYMQYQQAFGEQGLEQVRPEIELLLQRQQRQMALPAIIGQLRNKSEIRILESTAEN